jgi:hypothetical protein
MNLRLDRIKAFFIYLVRSWVQECTGSNWTFSLISPEVCGTCTMLKCLVLLIFVSPLNQFMSLN